MRGAAALMVVATHLGFLWGFATSGYLAVDLFFLLSGVVMASAYDSRIDAGMTTGQFMRMRLIRLYPMYFLGLLGCLLTSSKLGNVSEVGLGLAIFMLPSPDNAATEFQKLYPFMVVAWSLLFELVANLLFVALHRYLTTRVLLLIVAISGAALVAVTIRHGTMNGGGEWNSLDTGACRVMLSFFAGVLIWRHRAHLTFAVRPSIGMAVIVLVTLYRPPSLVIFGPIVTFFVWPALVIGGINRPSGGRAMTFLGQISYPTYCLQAMLMFGPVQALTPIVAVSYGVLLIAMAWAANRYYDKPVRAWLTRRTAMA